uniref:B30.2/SPRY domain-containing protein n=1 Tax=Cyprinus carpio TaxID=7962 RepID=A0A8C1KNR6_CYPCA
MKIHESLETLRRALTQLKHTIDEKLTQTELYSVFSVNVTLDPDTAHPKLILSDDGKQVRHGDIRQKLPDKPERFDPCHCVLGKEGFSSGRFYFEVQVKGKTDWDLGVARESINRKGKITARPRDGYWTVWLRNGDEYKTCDDPPVSLSLRVKPQWVGVFVHYEEGLVSFYDVESCSHIYSFTAQSFTEKLYPYFSPSLNYGGKNSNPLIITHVSYNK